MRLPRLRFTVRRLLVAVAVIAALWCAERMRQQRATQQRSEYYQASAALYRMFGRQFREAYATRSANVFAIQHGPTFAATPALRLKWARHYESLASKYEDAVSHPWEPVPPDPPPPEILAPGGDS
jgi:hypothetical protein